VWPVISALAAKPGISGELALVAFVAGFETLGRVAEAAGPGHYEGGWHVTGTAGHVAAAAAAGRALLMDPATLASAMGLSGTQAAGLKTSHGTDGKPFHAGKAAMDGLLSTLLVQGGMIGSTKVIEGQFGILWTMAPGSSAGPLLEGIGNRWHLPGNGYKAYPSGSLTHPAMDAILDLRAEHNFTADDVAKITAYVHSYAAAVTHYRDPKNRLEGRFSVTHGAAAALLHDQPSIDAYTDEAVTDPRAVAARGLVEIVVDDSVGKQGARVVIALKDGREFEATVKYNRGTPGNPLSDDDLAAKFRAVAQPRIGEQRTTRLLELVWDVDKLPDFSGIVELASGPAR
jgi:2-methylcitrate dehydratase PrpD